VGVVRNVRHSALEAEAGPEMYLLGAQNGWSSMDLVVRSRGSVAAIAPAVRAALRQVDPNTPTAKFQTLDDIVDQSVSPRRFITLLLTSFSFVALILASLGIYAVIAYSVSQRTHEIGVRLALGASARNVLLLIIRQGILPVLIGLAVGIAGTVALGHVLSNQLYGVSPTDPFTYLCVISVLLLVAFAACCFPARRATKVDPMVALRNE
jgi:ABC-type antimicrobial peptide transport system permease subunit